MSGLSTRTVSSLGLAAAAFLLAAGSSFAGPSDDACAGPAGPAREAGCQIKKAASDFAELQSKVQAGLGTARGAVDSSLALGAPASKDPGFESYFAGLKGAEAAFLRPHDAGGLGDARGKWQQAYAALREALRAQRDRLEPLPVALDKLSAGFAPVLEELASADKSLGAGGPELEPLRLERAGLEKRVRAYQKGLKETVRPSIEQSASALADLLFWLDGANVGLQSKLALGIYNDDWDDKDARGEQVDRAEGNDAQDLRDHRSADFSVLGRTRDLLNGDEWGG